jgi:Cu(I)/Ag(I) efflux system membrane protein CusA/SilA
MVIYLEEAVERKPLTMGGLTVQGLREAVMKGALLRLRPKIMTVSTVGGSRSATVAVASASHGAGAQALCT